MGEHKRPATPQKSKWDALRGHQWDARGTVKWDSQRKGTFQYHKQKPDLYGALQTRRQFKTIRKFIKKQGFVATERRELMYNVMGIDV